MNSIQTIREFFPILSEKVYGKPLVYLDNAATTQRPLSVIEKWSNICLKGNANLHRAVHRLAEIATEEYESTRDYVRDFMNAGGREEIIFTSGASHSLNLVAWSFSEAFLKAGDEIVIAQSEHHSDIVPWQMMSQRKGVGIKVLPVDESGHLRMDLLEELVNDKTKLLCVAHVSNVLGIVNPIKYITDFCHSRGCAVLVDGAQGVVHCEVDVKDLDCDFYVFSGHKIYAAPGTGVLYAKKKILEKMPPYMGGGEMIETVKFDRTTYAPIPGRFEAGTQNIAGIPTLKPAIEMVRAFRNDTVIKYCEDVRNYVMDALLSDKRVRLFGCPVSPEEKIPLFSISVEGAHHEDLALILDKMGIAVRSGQMCAEPLMDRFGVTGMLRASFAPYNTMEEAQYFIESLDRAIKMLQ